MLESYKTLVFKVKSVVVCEVNSTQFVQKYHFLVCCIQKLISKIKSDKVLTWFVFEPNESLIIKQQL